MDNQGQEHEATRLIRLLRQMNENHNMTDEDFHEQILQIIDYLYQRCKRREEENANLTGRVSLLETEIRSLKEENANLTGRVSFLETEVRSLKATLRTPAKNDDGTNGEMKIKDIINTRVSLKYILLFLLITILQSMLQGDLDADTLMNIGQVIRYVFVGS